VLRRIAEAEQIEVDDAVLDLIARAGRGSFRDAVSVLDQLATACDRRIGLDDARALLGVVDAATLVRLADLVSARDAAGLLVAVDALVEGGQDLGQLLSDLTEHVRHVFLTRQLGTPPRSAPLTVEARDDLVRQAQAFDERTLMAFADGLVAVQSDLREGGDPRLPLELLLVRLTRPAAERSVDALLRRVDALEAGAGHAPPAAPLPATPPPAPVTPAAQHEPIELDPTATAPAHPPEPLVPESPALPPPAPERTDEHDLQRIWDDEVMPRLEDQRPSLAATFRSAWPLALEGDVLRIAFPSTEQFAKSRADTDANRTLLAGVMASAFGERLRPRLETVDVQPEPVGAAAPSLAADAADPAANEQAWEDGLRETFGATEEYEE
jgi:DNA polymerase-3 subunit gamma/tau